MSHTSAIKHGSLGDRPMARTSLREVPQSSLTLVCSACRVGPFSYEGFRQAVGTRGYSDGTRSYCYTTTWSAISQSISNDGCSWCGIVRRTRDGLPPEKFPSVGDESVEVRFQVSAWRHATNGVAIYLNGYKAATCSIYAIPGEYVILSIEF